MSGNVRRAPGPTYERVSSIAPSKNIRRVERPRGAGNCGAGMATISSTLHARRRLERSNPHGPPWPIQCAWFLCKRRTAMIFKGCTKHSLVLQVVRGKRQSVRRCLLEQRVPIDRRRRKNDPGPTPLKMSRCVTEVISNMVKNAIPTKNVLGETDPVTRRMSNTATRRNLGSKRRSLEETEGVLDVINKQ